MNDPDIGYAWLQGFIAGVMATLALLGLMSWVGVI